MKTKGLVVSTLLGLAMGFILAIGLIGCSTSNTDIMENEKEGYVEVTGGKVWYRIVGADKPGTPLLTVHGGPGAPHDYLKPLETFAADRPVIFYDQLGCGLSDRPSDTALWTVSRFVEELDQVRKALHLNEIHLMGTSWGAMLTSEYLLRKGTEGVASLILSGPYLSSPRWAADQQAWIDQLPQSVRDTIEKYEESGDYMASAYQEAVMIFYREHVCRMDPWPKVLDDAMSKMGFGVYLYMWGPSEFTMTGTLATADITDQLHQIHIPVLLTCGEFDEATPATTEYYQTLFPNAVFHVFPGASHMHQLESEAEYLRVVGQFIEDITLRLSVSPSPHR